MIDRPDGIVEHLITQSGDLQPQQRGVGTAVEKPFVKAHGKDRFPFCPAAFGTDHQGVAEHIFFSAASGKKESADHSCKGQSTAENSQSCHSGTLKAHDPAAKFQGASPCVMDQLLFTYFHFACDQELTEAMMKSKSICLAYETVVDRNGALPLLVPMSEVAGKMGCQEGARFLEKPQGGRGILLGGVPGVKPAKVLVLGGGIVGTNAALMAAGLGADVTICDISLPRLRQLNEFMPKNVKTLFSSTYNIEQELPTTDLVIGAVLIPGAKTPHLITKDMLKLMRKGSVLVDVAIDQGGCFETSHPTTHAEPIYEVDGIVHYCVANIPGAVPCTSTLALTNATLPYAIRLADMGWEKACEADPGLKKGLNIVNGKIVFPAVAEAFGWEM